MAQFALFKDGVFSEVRSRPEQPEDLPQKNIKWYPVGAQKTGSLVGWKIVSGKAVETVAPAPTPPPRREGTFREFMDLFEPAEQQAIAGAAMTTVAVKLWYDRAMGGSIRLDHPDTAAGLAALVSAQVITQTTAARVLAADYDEAT